MDTILKLQYVYRFDAYGFSDILFKVLEFFSPFSKANVSIKQVQVLSLGIKSS